MNPSQYPKHDRRRLPCAEGWAEPREAPTKSVPGCPAGPEQVSGLLLAQGGHIHHSHRLTVPFKSWNEHFSSGYSACTHTPTHSHTSWAVLSGAGRRVSAPSQMQASGSLQRPSEESRAFRLNQPSGAWEACVLGVLLGEQEQMNF